MGVARFLAARPAQIVQLRSNALRFGIVEAFRAREALRRPSFDTMLQSVREYPGVLDVVGGAKAFDRVAEPGKALWSTFMKLRRTRPFLRFAIVPYGADAMGTLTHAARVLERYPKVSTHGVAFGKTWSIASPLWLEQNRERFPHLTVRYLARRDVPRGLRCEIIDLFTAERGSLPLAHFGCLFGYEQDGKWDFDEGSHWRDHIVQQKSFRLPPITLGLDVVTHGSHMKPSHGEDFPKPGFYADASGSWHGLRLRMGATKHGEFLTFGFPFDGDEDGYSDPVILQNT